MHPFLLTCGLAFRDWRHEGLLTWCSILSLVSILVPLLILLGIRNGVVETLKKRLLDNPAILTILPSGSGSGYTQAWLDTLADRPDVTFVIPKTREISTTVQMRSQIQGVTRFAPVDVEPTGPGDPLLVRFNAVPEDRQSITLSQVAAERLGVEPGDHIQGLLRRVNSAGKMESFQADFKVIAILPLEAESRPIGFVLLPTLVDIENYKDGFAIPEWKLEGDEQTMPEAERRFARFRLYARSMDDVSVLRDFFLAQGIEVQTSAMEIKSFQEINRALTMLFLLIAITVIAGFVASTSSNVLAGVRRKDKQLGMLRLLGFSSWNIRLFPIVQTQLTALSGCLLAAGLYICAAFGLDALFSEKFYGAAVSLMPFEHFLLITVGVCLAAFLASLPASRRAALVEPSEVVREL